MVTQNATSRKAAKTVFETLQQHIQTQFTRYLDGSGMSRPQRNLVLRTLREPGMLFCQQEEQARPSGARSLLTYLIARQVASFPIPIPLVSTIAASVECLMCSLDLLDDIEDGEETQLIQELGVSLVLNAAYTLDAISKRILLSVQEHGVDELFVTRLMHTQTQALLDATTGQHLDLIGETKDATTVSREDCLSVVQLKSASLMRMVCVLGAMSVNASENVCRTVAEFGENEGMAHQLSNDSHDLYSLLHGSHATHEKSDLVRRKKTLPIILATQRGCNPLDMSNENTASRRDYMNKVDEEIEKVWKLSSMYHTRAYNFLLDLTTQRPLDVALLRLLHFAPHTHNK